jgi:tRNA threonylcarbamoyladenosine biosynthesis protein TsaE
MFKTYNMAQTELLGEKLGGLLKPGDIVALTGDLGAGKTAFTRGVGRGLGINDDITSPTFTIINVYDGSKPLAHMDAYRLKGPEEMANIGFDDFLSGYVVVIEWAERIIPLLPEEILWIEIKTIDEKTREILLKYESHYYEKMILELNTK